MEKSKLCCACQWYKPIENESYCISCKPLMERFAKEINEKYGKDNKS